MDLDLVMDVILHVMLLFYPLSKFLSNLAGGKFGKFFIVGYTVISGPKMAHKYPV